METVLVDKEIVAMVSVAMGAFGVETVAGCNEPPGLVSVAGEEVVSVAGEEVVSVPGEEVVSVPGEEVVSVAGEEVVSVPGENGERWELVQSDEMTCARTW